MLYALLMYIHVTCHANNILFSIKNAKEKNMTILCKTLNDRKRNNLPDFILTLTQLINDLPTPSQHHQLLLPGYFQI